MDVVSGTLTISAPIVNGRGSSSPFPELASSLTKTGNGSLVLSGANAYTGGTTVSAGTLVVSGSVLGDVTLAAGSRLGGTGSFAGTVGGAGIFGPGTSPGITTTGSIDPSGGLGLEFEITGSLPAWANPTASVNDVIRITGGNPFTSALSAATTISILLGVPGLDPAALGTYTAGFFTDTASDFTSFIENAVFDYWVAGEFGSIGDRQQFPTGSGGAAEWYTRMAAYDPALSVQWQVVPVTADFGAGNVNGYSTQFVVVPEPAGLARQRCHELKDHWMPSLPESRSPTSKPCRPAGQPPTGRLAGWQWFHVPSSGPPLRRPYDHNRHPRLPTAARMATG
ncbi:MAG: autotransporter-associated beta strand repeat-containing protein [Planctomycetota bacterium]|nr:autotransporter-associated beta strand repeat-containing protein [Planctomycetota bacterium]